MTERWSIVGGGLLGLSLALRLSQKGNPVTLFEGENELGGLASSWSLNGITWDRHYHVILLSDLHLRSLLSELELEKEIIWRKTNTGFYTNGKVFPLSNALDYLMLPSLGILSKLRLGSAIVYASRLKDWGKLETISATEWLGKLCGQHTLENLWIPLLKAKLGESYNQASAAFIWAIIARLYAARRTGLKTEMFGYVPGGYAQILHHFRAKLENSGVQIKTNHRLKKVSPLSEGQLKLEFENNDSHIFSKCIVTTPSPLVAKLVPSLSPSEQITHSNIEYQGLICAALVMKRPLANCYLTYITDKSIPFTAVIEMSSLVDKAQFDGNSLVYLPKYISPNDPLFSLNDNEIQKIFLNGLGQMYSAFRKEDLVSFRVSREKHVFAITTKDYSKIIPPITCSIPGIYLVNSAQIQNGTLNANETVQLANRTVEKLL